MVGCLPGLSMRRIADLSPGSAKTDKRDAAAIAQTATTMLHTLRAISTSDDDTAALSILTGFDLDLARQVSQTANHIRGQCAPRSTRPRGRPGTPPRARRLLGDHSGLAGKARIAARLKKHAVRAHTAWAQQICDALDKQTVTAPAPTPPGRRYPT